MLAIGFLLIVGEVLVRLVGYRALGTYDENDVFVNTLTTGPEHGPFPRIRGRLYHVDFDVKWITNEQGFREREREPRAEGEWRVGLFGDSLMAGYGIERGERIGDLWFESVREKLAGTTLWNFGANNSGSYHLADFLAGAGRVYELDEIILGFYSGNEAKDNRRWERANAPSRVQTGKPRRSSLRRWLVKNSSLAKFIWMNWAARVVQRFSRIDAPQVARLEKEWPVIERGLERFRQAVGNRPFTLWYVPARFEWDEEHWEFTTRQQGITGEEGRYRLRDGVRDWARKTGTAFIDLTPALTRQPSESIRFPNDGHYTAEAHRRMAELIVGHGGGAAGLRGE